MSEQLAEPLSDAEATVQSMPDASPAKWHLAHTTWFFETFVLRDHVPSYRLFRQDWSYLFNSYYEAEGSRLPRERRGMLARPGLGDILEWRVYVDEAVESLLESGNDSEAVQGLVALGIAHEQQHQELLLTDIKHAMFSNPVGGGMWPRRRTSRTHPNGEEGWIEHPGGVCTVGHAGDGFSFDNEGPQHEVLLQPFALSPRLVTNGEWEAFIADGGYGTPSHWLSDGWAWVKRAGITTPLYWRDGEQFTHSGWAPRDPQAPVSHISYFEADAFATWAGFRLPTEFEWEVAAQGSDAASGNQLDSPGRWPSPPLPRGEAGLFGDCWQFTRSAYLPYPRFHPASGAVGEYNGKFMAGQWVLKGASCATPRGHSRATYRNFFYPQQRWQFTGLRLARDL